MPAEKRIAWESSAAMRRSVPTARLRHTNRVGAKSRVRCPHPLLRSRVTEREQRTHRAEVRLIPADTMNTPLRSCPNDTTLMENKLYRAIYALDTKISRWDHSRSRYLYHRIFLPVLAKAGIRRIRLHDLRHTFGSLLLQNEAKLLKDLVAAVGLEPTTYGL